MESDNGGLGCHSRKPTDTRPCSIEHSSCGILTGAKHSVIWPAGLENAGLKEFGRFFAAGPLRALNKLVCIMNIQKGVKFTAFPDLFIHRVFIVLLFLSYKAADRLVFHK